MAHRLQYFRCALPFAKAGISDNKDGTLAALKSMVFAGGYRFALRAVDGEVIAASEVAHSSLADVAQFVSHHFYMFTGDVVRLEGSVSEFNSRGALEESVTQVLYVNLSTGVISDDLGMVLRYSNNNQRTASARVKRFFKNLCKPFIPGTPVDTAALRASAVVPSKPTSVALSDAEQD